MAISVNHNLMAAGAARALNAHYSNLAASVQRLSSGLRINSASDDAAGLAIRELMRSDIAAAAQGARNANDAISLIQVADGALGIIDEKLIRMKELAEQAATGTYDSTQRLLIASEFQAMASEIDRIANATDFNGIKLLDGSLTGEHNGAKIISTGKLKIHFGAMNDSAEDYYYVEIGNAGTKGLGLRDPSGVKPAVSPDVPAWMTEDATIDWEQGKIFYDIPYRLAGLQDGSPAGVQGLDGIDYYELPVGLENVRIVSDGVADRFAHKPHVNIFTKDGAQLTGIDPNETYDYRVASADWPNSPKQSASGSKWWNESSRQNLISSLINAGLLDANAAYKNNIVNNAGQSVTAGGSTVTMETGMGMLKNDEIITIDKVTDDLVFMIGGHCGPSSVNCNHYRLTITADLGDEFYERYMGGKEPDIEDEGVIMNIETQEKAQKALARIDDAIVEKDKIRAHLGALQNRLENTVTNLSIQAFNLQAAESRISDTDVAEEMTLFVRNQVLTQSAVAMLGQANSYPHMLVGLLNG